MVGGVSHQAGGNSGSGSNSTRSDVGGPPSSSSSSSSLLLDLTHYDALDVSPTATLETIKSSYQSKARKLHPDKRVGAVGNDDEEVQLKFLRIQGAWECLRDVELRKEYDTNLALKKRQDESKYSKSQELTLEEWELVEEEESGDLCYVYSCRCGEEIWLDQDKLNNNNNRNKVSGSDSINNNNDKIYISCDGCSLIFHVTRQSFVPS